MVDADLLEEGQRLLFGPEKTRRDGQISPNRHNGFLAKCEETTVLSFQVLVDKEHLLGFHEILRFKTIEISSGSHRLSLIILTIPL